MDLKPLARLLGFPTFPVTITGLPLPLPTKYRIYFGEPLRFTGLADDEDSELDKKVRTVKTAIQTMLNQGLKERQGVFW
jgi:1-acyl-sn-glycerol-3-phosphate acyltransferase